MQDRIQFFFEGDDYYQQLFRDLEAARYSIFIEVYILAADEIGNQLKEILMRKASEGLTVKLLGDGIGSRNLPNAYVEELKRHRVEVRFFHPFRLFRLFQSTTHKRNHRKVVVIDWHIGYLGGFNFSKESSKRFFGERRWRDTQVRLQGQMVGKLAYYFLRSFKLIRFRSLKLEKFLAPNDIVATRNFFGRNQIRKFICRYLKQSRHFIYITTAYFVPDLEILYLIAKARKRGVIVKIITNGANTDVPLVNRVNRPLLKYLIKRGVEIYYYTQRMMHAKIMISDHKVAMVSSANFNYRSFFRDYEIAAFLHKEKWIKTLEEQFFVDVGECQRVSLQDLQQGFWGRLVDGFFYLLRLFF